MWCWICNFASELCRNCRAILFLLFWAMSKKVKPCIPFYTRHCLRGVHMTYLRHTSAVLLNVLFLGDSIAFIFTWAIRDLYSCVWQMMPPSEILNGNSKIYHLRSKRRSRSRSRSKRRSIIIIWDCLSFQRKSSIWYEQRAEKPFLWWPGCPLPQATGTNTSTFRRLPPPLPFPRCHPPPWCPPPPPALPLPPWTSLL